LQERDIINITLVLYNKQWDKFAGASRRIRIP
jgi:hypothetical protein